MNECVGRTSGRREAGSIGAAHKSRAGIGKEQRTRQQEAGTSKGRQLGRGPGGAAAEVWPHRRPRPLRCTTWKPSSSTTGACGCAGASSISMSSPPCRAASSGRRAGRTLSCGAAPTLLKVGSVQQQNSAAEWQPHTNRSLLVQARQPPCRHQYAACQHEALSTARRTSASIASPSSSSLPSSSELLSSSAPGSPLATRWLAAAACCACRHGRRVGDGSARQAASKRRAPGCRNGSLRCCVAFGACPCPPAMHRPPPSRAPAPARAPPASAPRTRSPPRPPGCAC